ncbi:MAG: DUF5117 domain-containing protein, partial [Phycisphaerales bacterium]|nr:DUF5117 domain-containing protein [Phycisphaerales bacterium]
MRTSMDRVWRVMMVAGLAASVLSAAALAQDDGDDAPAANKPGPGGPGASAKEPPEFPPFKDVTKGFERVVSGGGSDEKSFYTLWRREKDGRLLAELPQGFDRQRIFIATTFAGGVPATGIQFGELYGYWRRYDKRLALMEVNTGTKTTGDAESRKSEERLFTDRVVVDVPILAIGPGGGPVIDLTALFIGRSDKFVGMMIQGGQRDLVKIAKAKAFPNNCEVAFEVPDRSGTLVTVHHSISLIPQNTGYVPREADQRVGFFTTSFRDIARQKEDTQWVRYVNRWRIEKRDPKLRMSPPKQPIVFYIEATVPVQYRRFVREGVLEWNKAFARIGIDEAIEVYQQDATTGAHMDKDPEDVRYNFIRWTSSDLGFAIGPSRVHPETGEILDADVVIDDGFIRGWFRQFNQLLPEVAMLGYPAEVVAWFDKNPQWDPRVRLADPGERDAIVRQRAILRDAAERDQAAEIRASASEVASIGRGAGDANTVSGRSGSMPMLSLRSGAPLQF